MNKNTTNTLTKTSIIVELPPRVSIGELASIIQITPESIIKELMRYNKMMNINSELEFDTAAALLTRLGIYVRKPKDNSVSRAGIQVGKDNNLTEKNSKPRPPVVTILGHVDHGKTTLLDTIRGTNETDGEAGGITQSIGAYQIEFQNQFITFIDTPGHKAFTEIRERGAQVTDIAVLVVAADSGVQPQTVEAISHAKAAKVPIIVAINKIDLNGAKPDNVKSQLYEHGVIVEELGGDTVCSYISAKNNLGIQELLESILLVSEISGLNANPDRPGIGVVIESRIDRTKGAIASVIVRSGVVKEGDYVVAGLERGRIKIMIDGLGKRITKALPSTPIEILGLGGPPNPGDQFEVIKSDKEARKITKARKNLTPKTNNTVRPATMDEAIRSRVSSGAEFLNVLVKTDSKGSTDAIRRHIESISNKDTSIKVIHANVGPVNDSDIMLASASKGVVAAFKTPVEAGALKQSAIRGITIIPFDVVYEFDNAIAEYIEQKNQPEQTLKLTGTCKVLEVFPHKRTQNIAGIRVVSGSIRRNSLVKLVRDGKTLFEGKISSMRHFQENVRRLERGHEGGIILNSFDNFEKEDTIEAWDVST